MIDYNHITLFFISISTFCGIIIGYLLSLIAPEELICGKKYFINFKKILITIFISFFITFLFNNLIIKSIIFIILVILSNIILFKINIKNKYYSTFYYVSFLPIIIVSQNINYLITMSIIVYILSTVYSTIFSANLKYVKNEKIINKITLFKHTMLNFYPYLIFSNIGIIILIIIDNIKLI
ncbi:MAG: hypothetical protein ACLFPJ_01790 [Candidatus Woesearchaeota archaeon]